MQQRFLFEFVETALTSLELCLSLCTRPQTHTSHVSMFCEVSAQEKDSVRLALMFQRVWRLTGVPGVSMFSVAVLRFSSPFLGFCV